MTVEELEQLVVLLRKLKAHIRKGGAPLMMFGIISDMRKVTNYARKIGLK